MEPNETLIELNKIVGAIVETIVIQSEIKTDLELTKQFFRDQKNFSLFFKEFANYANPTWNKDYSRNWDFSKVPFKESSERIEGLSKF